MHACAADQRRRECRHRWVSLLTFYTIARKKRRRHAEEISRKQMRNHDHEYMCERKGKMKSRGVREKTLSSSAGTASDPRASLGPSDRVSAFAPMIRVAPLALAPLSCCLGRGLGLGRAYPSCHASCALARVRQAGALVHPVDGRMHLVYARAHPTCDPGTCCVHAQASRCVDEVARRAYLVGRFASIRC